MESPSLGGFRERPGELSDKGVFGHRWSQRSLGVCQSFREVFLLPPSPVVFSLNVPSPWPVMSVARIAADELERITAGRAETFPGPASAWGLPPTPPSPSQGEQSCARCALPPTARSAPGVTQAFSLPSATLLPRSQLQGLQGLLDA